MLEKFAAEVPDIDPKRSVIGGHSNDAHTLSVLLAGRDEFISKHFHAFWLHESGFQGRHAGAGIEFWNVKLLRL